MYTCDLVLVFLIFLRQNPSVVTQVKKVIQTIAYMKERLLNPSHHLSQSGVMA